MFFSSQYIEERRQCLLNVSFLSFHVISPLNFHKRKTEPKTEPLKQENEKPAENQRVSFLVSGERGIRTPGTSQCGSFQDCCNRPLYHLSKCSLSESGCKGTKKSEKRRAKGEKNAVAIQYLTSFTHLGFHFSILISHFSF